EGSSEPNARLTALLGVVADVLGETINPIAVRGHLDAVSLRTQSYDVWDLSTDRALEARRTLVRAGVGPERVAQVAGKGDRSPSVEDVFDPRNRRLEIVLLRQFEDRD
ncbi:MAG: OmpA family protein, partial [Pseudomonadota bacterium]